MRTLPVAIIIACCLSLSNATFGLLKSKARPQPTEGLPTLQYLPPPPVAIPVPVPASYARPASTFSKHVATYRLPSPPPAVYLPPPTYSVSVHPQTIPVGYTSPFGGYRGLPSVYLESPPSAQVVEEYYSACEDGVDGSFNWK